MKQIQDVINSGIILPDSINAQQQQIRHEFACWTASTAARAARSSCSFEVWQGRQIINTADFLAFAASCVSASDAGEYDDAHARICEKAILAANDLLGKNNGFSFGVAAKLLNVYMKTAVMIAVQFDDPRLRFLQPPIDSILLDALIKRGFKPRMVTPIRWSKLTPEQYDALINDLRCWNSREFGDQPLWLLEGFWKIPEKPSAPKIAGGGSA